MREELPAPESRRLLAIARRQASKLVIGTHHVYAVRSLGGLALGATLAARIVLDPRAFRRVRDPRLKRVVAPRENLKRTLLHEYAHVLQSIRYPDLYWSGEATDVEWLERLAYRFEDFWYSVRERHDARS